MPSNPSAITEERHCPQCASTRVSTQTATESFPYGLGDDQQFLTASIPVHTCSACGFRFRDAIAEDIKHEAVCRHLGVMTPSEIHALRDRLGLSRADFANLTRLGDASIARWERGESIQTAAYDQLLYLLMFDDNLRRLRERDCPPAAEPTQHSPRIRVRALTITPAIIQCSQSFVLQRTGTDG